MPTELGLVPAAMTKAAAVPSNRADLLVGAVRVVAKVVEVKVAIVKVVAAREAGN